MDRLQVPVTVEDHIQGNAKAKVTLVEYGDYQCPHCGMAHPAVKAVQKLFGEQLWFVYRNFPLLEIHELAEPAAEDAEFAGTRRRFWEMHDAIFDNQPSLSLPMLLELADALGLDSEKAEEAIVQHEYATKIEKDMEGGVRSGVQGTPTFFINGVRHEGGYGIQDLAAAIQAAGRDGEAMYAS
jgi:protein-disulfide isomerase